MYWKVKNFSPEHLFRMYAMPVGLIISILLNVLLFTTRPSPSRGLNAGLKRDFETLAKDVTNQILDSSFVNYEKNTTMLLTAGELDPPLIKRMKQNEMLPNSNEAFKANVRTLADAKQVVAVRIDQVVTGDPTPQGLVPVDVGGVVASHSASGAESRNFHFKYIMGTRKTGQMETNPDINSHSHFAGGGGRQQVEVQVPVVADIQDLSGQPMPAGPAGAPYQ
jgi:hypothetical protein